MCQAHIKLWFGLAWLSIAWLVWALVWAGLGWFGLRLKLNYQVSLLSLGGGGWGKAKLRLNPAWAELGKKISPDQPINQ